MVTYHGLGLPRITPEITDVIRSLGIRYLTIFIGSACISSLIEIWFERCGYPYNIFRQEWSELLAELVGRGVLRLEPAP